MAGRPVKRCSISCRRAATSADSAMAAERGVQFAAVEAETAAGRQHAARDQAVGDPAVDGGRTDPKVVGGLGDGEPAQLLAAAVAGAAAPAAAAHDAAGHLTTIGGGHWAGTSRSSGTIRPAPAVIAAIADWSTMARSRAPTLVPYSSLKVSSARRPPSASDTVTISTQPSGSW